MPATVQPKVVGRFHLELRRVTAYPIGVELVLRGATIGVDLRAGRDRGWIDGIEMTVELADGRRAGLRDSAGMKSGTGPMLSLGKDVTWKASGGGVHDVTAELRLWVWPLPPEGTFTVRCTWPDAGLEEATIGLDGSALRAALGGAVTEGAEGIEGSEAPSAPAEAAAVAPAETVVPDLVGMDVLGARRAAGAARLFLEHADPDGPPLASGVVVRQEPSAGTAVASYTRVVAWATGEVEGPPRDFDPGPDDGPPGPPGGGWPPEWPTGDREPRRPGPRGGHGRATADELGLAGSDAG